MTSHHIATTVVTTFALAVFANSAAAQFTFIKVADTATPVPGGAGAFSGFSSSTAVVSGSNVAFLGYDADGNNGVYLFDGSALSQVATAGDPVPGLGGLVFEFFGGLSLSGGTVGFSGFTTDSSFNQVSVVLTATGGALTNRADSANTTSPSTGTTFGYVDSSTAFGGDVAFYGQAIHSGGSTVEGIYTDAGGSLATVVDLSTPVPGPNLTDYDFNGFNPSVAFNGNIGIRASVRNPDTGDFANVILLATPGGPLANVADTVNTVSPSTNSVFDDLSNEPSVDGTNYAFAGSADDVEGIYTNLTGPPTTVADQNTAVPGQPGLLFTEFDNDKISIDGGRIVFEGFFGDDGKGGSTGGGLYLFENGMLSRILDNSEMLDGKTIDELNFAFEGAIDGDTLAFVAEFTDGSQGIFTTVIHSATSADLDNNGVVDVFDLLDLLGNWGTNGPGADIAAPNNVVDVFDLLELLAQWG